MEIATSHQQARRIVAAGNDCILVAAHHDPKVIGRSVANGELAVYWFATYTKQGDRIGWHKQASAHQIKA